MLDRASVATWMRVQGASTCRADTLAIMAATAAMVGVGLAAGAGAAAAAVRAARTKANPKRTQYGGSYDALDNYRSSYATGADQGNAAVTQGQKDLQQSRRAGQQMAGEGARLQNEAGQIMARPVTTTGAQMLGAYQPGAVAAAQSQQMLDANTAANLGAARSGGALGLRNALNANANSGVQAAQAMAVQRAQEEQQLLAARVGQENMDRTAISDAEALAQQQRMQQTQVGAGIRQAGLAQNLQAGTAGGQLGLQNQAQYLASLQGVEEQQLAADNDFDTRRQQEQQRKSNNLWGFAGGLTGIAGKALGGMGG